MRFLFGSDDFVSVRDEVLVLFATETKTIKGGQLKRLDRALGGALGRLFQSGEFSGSSGQVASFVPAPGLRCRRVLVVGLGEEKKLDHDSFRRAVGDLSRYKGFTQARSVAVHFGEHADASFYQAAVEGYLLGSFRQLDYRTGESARDDSRLAGVRFLVHKASQVPALRRAVERGRIISDGQILARKLAQTPAGDLTPRLYAAKARRLARQHRVRCRVLNEKAIARERMGALLGVARGSDEPPRFIVLEYEGQAAGKKPVVLVGKGVTFDSGGISLKPGQDMHEMKGDMAGSAVVLATMITAARLKLPLHLVGLMPLTENMPSGHATRPGDILKSRKGKTIEVINTDAEGRLILADALDYAGRFKPQAVIDIATLTGATLYILGYAGAPIVGNNDALVTRLENAASATAERVWRLPIWDDHRDQMKGTIADLVNSGGRPAGTIAAAAFLENFIGDWPWAHIDIAYVDLEPKGRPYVPKGATGFGVRLLVEMLARWKPL